MHVCSLALGYALFMGQLRGLHVGAVPADFTKSSQIIEGRHFASRNGAISAAVLRRLDTGPAVKLPSTPSVPEAGTNKPELEQYLPHDAGLPSGAKEPAVAKIDTSNNCRTTKRGENEDNTAESMGEFWNAIADYLNEKARKAGKDPEPLRINVWGSYSSAKLPGGDVSQSFKWTDFSYADGTTEEQIAEFREAREHVWDEDPKKAEHTRLQRLFRNGPLQQYNKHDGRKVDFGSTHDILQIRHGSSLLELTEQMDMMKQNVEERNEVSGLEKQNAAVTLHELTANKGDVRREQLATVLKAMGVKDDESEEILTYTPDLVLQGMKPEWLEKGGFASDITDSAKRMDMVKDPNGC